jgi:polysaccharide export outer membrane protein
MTVHGLKLSLRHPADSFSRAFPVAWLFLAALLLPLLVGCAGTRGGPVPYNVENFGKPDSAPILSLSDDYKIAPKDTLKVTVFQVTDLSGEYEVDLTGHIAMPLIGNVKAAELTTAELDREITTMLGHKYLQSPDVSVGVKESARSNITVDGSVRQPGLYPVTGPMTLMQAVAMARGTDENANPRRVAVFRQVKGQRMAAAFDLTSIRRGEAEDPQVYTGDIVVVDGSQVKAIQREILQALPVFSIFRPF